MSFRIVGTGSAYPEKVVTNDDLSTFLDTSDEWIVPRTGIKSRHVCTTESNTDLAEAAGRRAVENAGIDASSLDLIICALVRGDYFTPSTACAVQGRLGASCPAFDVNAACSGFIYALDTAAGFLARGRAKRILVIAMEAVSRFVDWTDRSTCVLFGDGAGAVVLEQGDDLLSIGLAAQGDEEFLVVPVGENTSIYSQTATRKAVVNMNGNEVYKFAVNSMCRDLEAVIAEAGIEQEDITYVLPHQANLRIIKTAMKHLTRIPDERFQIHIDRFGNTSAAGIPIMLDEMNRSGKLKKGDLLALSAFGGGLTSGACVLRWSLG